jgi:hypothetical protein
MIVIFILLNVTEEPTIGQVFIVSFILGLVIYYFTREKKEDK